MTREPEEPVRVQLTLADVQLTLADGRHEFVLLGSSNLAHETNSHEGLVEQGADAVGDAFERKCAGEARLVVRDEPQAPSRIYTVLGEAQERSGDFFHVVVVHEEERHHRLAEEALPLELPRVHDLSTLSDMEPAALTLSYTSMQRSSRRLLAAATACSSPPVASVASVPACLGVSTVSSVSTEEEETGTADARTSSVACAMASAASPPPARADRAALINLVL